MAERHIPGRIQIGMACNQKCLFCSEPTRPGHALLTPVLKKRMRELKKFDINDLFITGGEPTVHENLFEILDYAKKLEFHEVTIQTNGTKLTKDFLKRIEVYGNVKFCISFHSYDEETCNTLSQSSNYRTLLNGLESLKKAGNHVFLAIVINKMNYKHLKEHIQFIRKHFPNITHFSLNFIDPTGRANENKWIVPVLVESEKYIHDAVMYILENNMTFRLERVPLCYMRGFEEFSTEARMLALDKKKITYFAQKIMDNGKRLCVEKELYYHKTEICTACTLNEICPGLNPRYVEIHGDKEIYPVFDDPREIKEKIRTPKMALPGGDTRKKELLKRKVSEDLLLFKDAIAAKPNKNNIYDTYAYFLMENIGFKNDDFIYNKWKTFTEKVRKGFMPDKLSFYIHFPFCRSTCDYCIYPSTKTRGKKEIADYIEYLRTEMKKYAPLFKGLKFKTLSIGGGTPSLMDEAQLRFLLKQIFTYYDFDEKGEKSIEFNPNTSTYEKLKIIESFGFNKLSLGVQSLCKEVLKANNRGYQEMEKIRQTVKDFKKTTINYLNIDLLLGLKGDKKEYFLKTFEEVCRMKPSLISIYPIKTNDNYIRSRYGRREDFFDFYYPLFDGIKDELPLIAGKCGYFGYKDSSKLSYVHPSDFKLKDAPKRDIKYIYSNFKVEPYSNFGLGYYAESNIHDTLRAIHVDRNHPSTLFLKYFSTNKDNFGYVVNGFLKNYSRVKMITHSVYENFAVPRKKYQEMFKTDILNDFPYAVWALKHLGVISVYKKEIRFNTSDEKEVYPYLLFFVGRAYVARKDKKCR